MKFLPYRLWDDPPIVAFQDRREDRLLPVLRELAPGTHLLFHCSGTTAACHWCFERLSRIRARFSHVTFHLLANTDAELGTFSRLGLPCGYGPVSLYVDEATFRPELVEKEYDAVYIARFTPGDRNHFKRHLLAASVPSLSVITFALAQNHEQLAPFGPFSTAFWATYPELGHAAVNDAMLNPDEVARGINRARVNLALSRAEGCMLCFTEGLLCGVPAVSTACDSARTEFFDPRFVAVVKDDAGAVAEGVREMAARHLDPTKVREFALERLRAMRLRYADYVATVAQTQTDEVCARLFNSGAHRLAYSPQGE
jgi:hypothetical protein